MFGNPARFFAAYDDGAPYSSLPLFTSRKTKMDMQRSKKYTKVVILPFIA